MFKLDDPALTSDELTRRAREEVRRRRVDTTPLPRRPSAPSGERAAAQWAAVHQAIATAEQLAVVGATLPPMHRMRGWRRLVAVPLAKLILRAASLVTRDQTSFNVETVKAVRILGETISQQQRALEDRHATARDEQDERLEHLAAKTARQHDLIEQRLATLDQGHQRTTTALQDASQATHEVDEAVRRTAADLLQLRTLVTLQERRLATLLEEGARGGGPAGATAAAELEHLLDPLYVSFEDRFRGSRDAIKDRARAHLDPVRAAGAGTAERPILDVACGRGEWLELLREEGLVAHGVDANRILVDENHARGLDVVGADAFAFLRELPEGSQGAVTSFHFVEHLPFQRLVAFLDEVLRVLEPGGVAVFETPNPKNLIVGASYFWVDPTHQNPIFPETLHFLVEARGFVRASIVELHPVDAAYRFPDDGSPVTARLNEYLFGPQDFAVVCHRA